MEGRVCFECLWGLKPVLVYALCHTKPIFDFDYHYKRSNNRTICHRVSAAICIGRPICLCSSAAMCIDRSICHRWRAAICIGKSICHPDSTAICIGYTNMPPSSIWFTIHIEIHIVLSKVWNVPNLQAVTCPVLHEVRAFPNDIGLFSFCVLIHVVCFAPMKRVESRPKETPQ